MPGFCYTRYMFDQYVLNFVVVVVVQLACLLAHAALVGRISSVPKVLAQGLVIGLPFGLVTDFIWGRLVGVFTYQLGFIPWFLVLNGLFSYGVWMANVLLLRKNSFIHVYLVSVMLAVVYEVANYYWPVWEWTFGVPYVEYGVVIFILYTSLMWCAVYLLRTIETRSAR